LYQTKVVSASETQSYLAAMVLGAVGLVCGFFGPIALNNQANQGPLFGLFLAGPLGFVAGFVFGSVTTQWRVSTKDFTSSLAVLAVGFGLMTLYESLPPDRYRAFVIDAEVLRCESPNLLLAQTRTRPGWWCHDPSQMRQLQTSVVLTTRVHRRWEILEHQKPWNRGQLTARRSRDFTGDRYFLSENNASCGKHPVGSRDLYVPNRDSAHISAENSLSECLGLYVLNPVPGLYRALIQP
jgi:hypothetical protein